MSVAVPTTVVSTFTHMKKSCCPLPRVMGSIFVGGLPSPSHGIFTGLMYHLDGLSYPGIDPYHLGMPSLFVHDCLFDK